MPKSSSVYVCQQCGFQSSSYLGKCPQCDSWNSFVEQLVTKTPESKSKIALNSAKAVNIQDLEKRDFERISTKIDEFNRVLGGGVVPGSLILLAGDPGIGKSTLLTQLAINITENVIARSPDLIGTTKQSSKEI